VPVQTEPRDLDRAALTDALTRHWGIHGPRLEYLPVGYGSHHWQAVAADGSRWFVTADALGAGGLTGRSPEDSLAALDRAFRTAVTLHGAGLEFVQAPIPSRDGSILHRVGPGYAIRVEAFVEGTAEGSGEFGRPEERRQVAELIGRLHAASATVPHRLPRREDFALAGREALGEALADLGTAWEQGPFAEPARALLGANADGVRGRLRAYDQLAQRVRDHPEPWVVTHGEPHSANLIRQPDGGLRLVDWDTTLIGPRERDLWVILDADRTGWHEYCEATGVNSLNEETLGLYRERWALAEICEYVAEFRRPHGETDDTRSSWEILGEYLQ
jgi:spectinomycin phosphotransferase